MTRRAISSRSACAPMTPHASRRGGAAHRMSVLDKTAARRKREHARHEHRHGLGPRLHGHPRPHPRPPPLRAARRRPGTPAGALAALDGYRNPDGGYGWGLEGDLRSPESQPAAALHAFEVFAETGRAPQAATLCHWLDTGELSRTAASRWRCRWRSPPAPGPGGRAPTRRPPRCRSRASSPPARGSRPPVTPRSPRPVARARD